MLGKIKEGVVAIEGAAKAPYEQYATTQSNSWIGDHCHGLWVKPSAQAPHIDHFKGQVEQLKANLVSGIDAVLRQAGASIMTVGSNAVVSYAQGAAVRQGAAMASLVVPVAGEIIVAGVTIFNIVGGIWTAGKAILEAKGKAMEAYKKIEGMQKQLGKLQDLLDGKISLTELWADVMTGLAFANPCMQARRCQLVSYGGTTSAHQTLSGHGCCPGQTGHHMLPGEMFEECEAYKTDTHNKAPTVCVEGVNNTHGSHGMMHSKLDSMMLDHVSKLGDKISLDEAIAAAVRSHNETFKPACDPRCLTEQLKSYYKNVCKGKIKPRGGKGTDMEKQIHDPSKKLDKE
ncbi:MAG: hypothetical protein RLZZ618_158 [Pseudomonadota bacterium]